MTEGYGPLLDRGVAASHPPEDDAHGRAGRELLRSALPSFTADPTWLPTTELLTASAEDCAGAARVIAATMIEALTEQDRRWNELWPAYYAYANIADSSAERPLVIAAAYRAGAEAGNPLTPCPAATTLYAPPGLEPDARDSALDPLAAAYHAAHLEADHMGAHAREYGARSGTRGWEVAAEALDSMSVEAEREYGAAANSEQGHDAYAAVRQAARIYIRAAMTRAGEHVRHASLEGRDPASLTAAVASCLATGEGVPPEAGPETAAELHRIAVQIEDYGETLRHAPELGPDPLRFVMRELSVHFELLSERAHEGETLPGALVSAPFPDMHLADLRDQIEVLNPAPRGSALTAFSEMSEFVVHALHGLADREYDDAREALRFAARLAARRALAVSRWAALAAQRRDE